MRGLPSIWSLFRNKFNKFNNIGAWMLDSILSHDIKIKWQENVNILSSFMQRKMDVMTDLVTECYKICKPLVGQRFIDFIAWHYITHRPNVIW